ncbi:hypothetical protein [Streptomyces sp. SM11]|uniref:hypothetical protein n=1 Tax=Streptomyces sp. SM11 TaxID=565557 RepID=UPI0015E1A451|nr:hypothetical protein [Streptomyces sp. SM11]
MTGLSAAVVTDASSAAVPLFPFRLAPLQLDVELGAGQQGEDGVGPVGDVVVPQ